MTSGIIDIGPWQLGFGLLFILIAGAASLYHSLHLEKDLLIGTVRTFAQLFLLGYVLKLLFDVDDYRIVLSVFLFMILFAAWTVYGRIREKQITFLMPVCLSMVVSFFLITFMVTAVVIDVKPWWTPQYFIPIGGMVIGNSMNAIAIALERLLNEMRSKRREIEMKLCLGADYKEASVDIVRDAMKAGMIPSINSMMTVGIVFIPGMMTGQILAGADPMTAIEYQIMVMIMIVGATALGTLLVVLVTRKRCFSPGHQLLLKPGS
ncbi:MAG: iron export ABC transporter permease subunit FetB [Desulfobacteraceae bacterium]|nr:MAG: iron export ABC transporter permease subunit FetB [Desulfobacteraceae bacterium]